MKNELEQFHHVSSSETKASHNEDKGDGEKQRDALVRPIVETENAVSYLGVELPKGMGGDFCPKKETYEGTYINDEFSLELQKKIATAWKLDQPILIEGGTSIGKTTTVRKMCAELGWEVYYKNCNGSTDVEDFMGRYIPNPYKVDRSRLTDDQYAKLVAQWKSITKDMEPALVESKEYIFADGPVTAGLRQEDGKIKVIYLDEYNSVNPSIAIRLHEVLDELEHDGEVMLAEDAFERVQVSKQTTKIIASANPPGGGYLERQPFDPAQLRRWNYQKEVTDLPEDVFIERLKVRTGLAKKEDIESNAKNAFLYSNEYQIPSQELGQIPGMLEWVGQYREFHFAAKKLLKNRKIAQDQPQPFTFDDEKEQQRVVAFIQNFYRGDINAVWREALKYFYVNKLEDETDRAKLMELVNAIEYVRPVESKRKGVEREDETMTPEQQEKVSTLAEIEKIKKRIAESGKVPEGFFAEKERGVLSGEISEQIKDAREILGTEDVLGPKEIEHAFGLKLKTEDIPRIPFGMEELEQAKELGQFLILRTHKAKDGSAFTMQEMQELLADKFKKDEDGKIFYDTDWYREEDFFTQDTPELSWALSGKEMTPDSNGKNYFQQTEGIVEYLKEEVFKGGSLPKTYQTAVKEFADRRGEIEERMSDNWQEAARILSELKITKLTRQKPVEFMYDILAYFKSNRQRLYENAYAWTGRRTSDGRLVRVGAFDAGGVYVGRWTPGDSDGSLGVVFSRSL